MAEEVSGQAAFWILLSLATAAIAQPTRSWRRKERDLFGGHVDLARCIPTVCFIDAVCDLIFLGISARRSLSTSDSAPARQRILPKASALIVKLALSVFTVLPQTIKVFSLKGVPGTQTCAFLFFLAFTTKLLVDICGLEEEEEENEADSVETKDDSLDGIVLAAVLLQTPFEVWIWCNISNSGSLQAPHDLAAFCTWSASCCVIIMVLQIIIWIMYVLVRQRFDVTGSPHVVPMRGLYILLLVLGVAKSGPEAEKSTSTIVPPPDSVRNFTHGLSLMSLTGILSLAVTKVLDFGIRALLSEKTQPTVPTLDTQSTINEDSTVRSEEETFPSPPNRLPISWVGKIGTVMDRWVERILTARSAATVTMMLAVFNLITTIVYYLVCFDGTGTENPSWTSVLG
ncbi:Ff.00g113320.m01.CDS01 [Fusarium sp. VM40]|nr:Ff.00g113320.m01.CDS01 [Fusarium sp. VM40]